MKSVKLMPGHKFLVPYRSTDHRITQLLNMSVQFFQVTFLLASTPKMHNLCAFSIPVTGSMLKIDQVVIKSKFIETNSYGDVRKRCTFAERIVIHLLIRG